MTIEQVVQLLQAVSPIGAASLVVWGIRLIAKGALVPRSTMEDRARDWEARLAESRQREQDWKAAADANSATVAEYADQFSQLLTTTRTTEALIRALPTGRTRE